MHWRPSPLMTATRKRILFASMRGIDTGWTWVITQNGEVVDESGTEILLVPLRMQNATQKLNRYVIRERNTMKTITISQTGAREGREDRTFSGKSKKEALGKLRQWIEEQGDDADGIYIEPEVSESRQLVKEDGEWFLIYDENGVGDYKGDGSFEKAVNLLLYHCYKDGEHWS